MTVIARLKCEKPDDIDFTLTLTMPARDWERLREQFGEASWQYPACDVRSKITDLLAQARKIYWPNETSE